MAPRHYKKPAPPTRHMQHRFREAVLILTSAISLFLLFALITYTPIDPAWNETFKKVDIMNAGGRAGAFFSDLFLYLLGHLAYLFPFMLTYSAWLYFRQKDPILTEDELSYYLMIKSAGFILILIPGCALFALHPNLEIAYPKGTGGILGLWAAVGTVHFFNVAGALLILSALFLTGITLFTGLSWFSVMDFLGEHAWRVGESLVAKLHRMKENRAIVEEETMEWEKPTQPKSSARASRLEPKIKLGQMSEPSFDINEPFIMPQPAGHKVNIETKSGPVPKPVKPKAINRDIFQPSSEESLPPLSLLDPPDRAHIRAYTHQQLEEISREVELRLKDFGIQVKVVAVHPGPVVTRFELQLAAGTKVSRITALDKDLARSLSVISVRVVEVIPGKSVIGLELPNIDRETVRLREILSSHQYQTMLSPLALATGKDIAGNSIVLDLARMPHLLVAGTTGSGKSVGLNAMLLSLLYKAVPSELRLILIDPKMLELSIYEGIPHLLTPVVTDMKDAANALRWCVAEMDRRYRLMAAMGVRNLAGFNHKVKSANEKKQPIVDPFWQAGTGVEATFLEELPAIVVLIDEFADMMMMVGKKVEELIARIAQKARAAGIHLILATQRPSVDVITGLIKANIPTRMAFQVSSKIDSRTILDQSGAEQLLGNGDMLYLPPGTGVPIRVHGAFVADEEVHRVVEDLRARGQPQYREDVLQDNEQEVEGGSETGSTNTGEQDALYDQAVQIVVETRRASISHIQRRLRIGYNRAANIVEAMEAAGVISRMDAGGTREILVASEGGVA